MGKLGLIGGLCLLAQAALLQAQVQTTQPSRVWCHPKPDSEEPSPLYVLKVNGEPCFVYAARVRQKIDTSTRLWSHRADAPAEAAAFACFDFVGRVSVEVHPTKQFQSAMVLPASANIASTIKDGTITLVMDEPRPMTILLDGSDREPLHLFCSPPELPPPDAKDPNVIYFGPGVHEIHKLELRAHQTLYLAPGAILKAVLTKEDKGTYSPAWQVTTYGNVIHAADAEGITIRGRGIIDCSALPHPARSAICLERCNGARIEGIVLRDCSNWAVHLDDSENVEVSQLKEISARLNTDGINSVSCRHVRIHDCFVRNRDDSIAVKTRKAMKPASDIRVERCTIWSDWGYSLGVTYETRSNIDDVTFSDCDIIHTAQWALGVHVADSGTVSNVRFENIRVHQPRTTPLEHVTPTELIHLDIRHDAFATDSQAGHISGVHFADISATTADGKGMSSSIEGFDREHSIKDVTLRGITVDGKAIRSLGPGIFSANEYVEGIEFRDH